MMADNSRRETSSSLMRASVEQEVWAPRGIPSLCGDIANCGDRGGHDVIVVRPGLPEL